VEPAGGKVYDAINSSRVVSKGSTTYNQGTYIGSAVALGRVADAKKAADWTKVNMCNADGIFRESGQGDFGTFKMIGVRYVVGLSRETGGEAYTAWMESNAAKVWANGRRRDPAQSAGQVQHFHTTFGATFRFPIG
jgi:predicted alpha-1,6-mannanase (GH76 family)